MAVADATVAIQARVDNALGNQINGGDLQRAIALNYIGVNNAFYIKVLAFHDQPQNCIHVRIEDNANGEPVLMGQFPQHMAVNDTIQANFWL